MIWEKGTIGGCWCRGVRLAVEYVTMQGQMVSFLVRLEKVKEGGEWRLSARYDTCHGRPHLDVVNEKGSWC